MDGAGPPPGRRVSDEHQSMAIEVRDSGRPVVRLEPPRVVVAAPDRPGLLSSVAGTLALHGLDVRSADVAGDEGIATEVFTVVVARGGWPDSDRLRQDLEAVLSDRLALDDRLAAKAQDYAASRRPQMAHPIDPVVLVDNDASASATVIEVRATDEVGLLHRVTRALFDCDVDVMSARVSTIGDIVVDAFYVRGQDGGKLAGAEQLAQVEHTLMVAVTGGGPN
jgi:[protein-PII] uridylyltransferase